jgi:hypothetical protein
LKAIKAVLLFFLFANFVYCQEPPLFELKKSDFNIENNGIILGLRQSYFRVVSKRLGGIGIPKDSTSQKLSNRGSLFVMNELIYPGLNLYFSYQSIEKIEITDKKFKTPRNISIGMSEADVIKSYGRAHIVNQVGFGKTQLAYQMQGDDVLVKTFEINFEISNKKVERIILQINYNDTKLLIIEDFIIEAISNNGKYHVMQNINDIVKNFPENLIQKKPQNEIVLNQIGNCVFYTFAKENEVYEIEINGSGWVTRRGIVVGDSKEKVLSTYGIYDDLTIIHQDGKEVLNYVFTNFGQEEVFKHEFSPQFNALLLDFVMEKGKVKEIKLLLSEMGD